MCGSGARTEEHELETGVAIPEGQCRRCRSEQDQDVGEEKGEELQGG